MLALPMLCACKNSNAGVGQNQDSPNTEDPTFQKDINSWHNDEDVIQ